MIGKRADDDAKASRSFCILNLLGNHYSLS
jgi:hypothetical protein